METTTSVICIIYVNFFIFISVLRDPRITQWEVKLHFLNDRNHSQVALLKWQVQKFFCGKKKLILKHCITSHAEWTCGWHDSCYHQLSSWIPFNRRPTITCSKLNSTLKSWIQALGISPNRGFLYFLAEHRASIHYHNVNRTLMHFVSRYKRK